MSTGKRSESGDLDDDPKKRSWFFREVNSQWSQRDVVWQGRGGRFSSENVKKEEKWTEENACTSDLFASDATAGALKIPL